MRIAAISNGMAFLALTVAAGPASAITIDLVNTGGAETGSAAYAGFRAAANFWETYLTGGTAVTIEVGFADLGASVLGSTGSSANIAYVGDILPALQAAATSSLDAMAMANLPATRPSTFIGGAALDAYISAPKANGAGVAQPLRRVLDKDASANNSALAANTALLKQLGFTPDYSGYANDADGSVIFSSSLAWDFNPIDGIALGAFDFIGIAVHEIGHALGFRSGVDTIDINAGGWLNLNQYATMSVLDIFRYSNASGINDWSLGTASYFSVDGGATPFMDGYFSTGQINGDGWQASHWKNNGADGIMGPTLATGALSAVTALDLAAFDAMGWTTLVDVFADPGFTATSADIWAMYAAPGVPEPASWLMLIAGFGMIGLSVRTAARRTASGKRPLPAA